MQSTTTAAALAAAQEENNKLTKQLRIQNKAKFVTKKLKSGSTVDDVVADSAAAMVGGAGTNVGGVAGGVVVVASEDDLGLGPVSSSTLFGTSLTTQGGHAHESSGSLHNNNNNNNKNSNGSSFAGGVGSAGIATQSFRLAPANLVLPTSTNSAASSDEPQLILSPEFLSLLESIKTEQEIKALQKQLMMEKRGLRLQQQQQVGADPAEGTDCI